MRRILILFLAIILSLGLTIPEKAFSETGKKSNKSVSKTISSKSKKTTKKSSSKSEKKVSRSKSKKSVTSKKGKEPKICEYKVEKGDTPSKVASKFGMTVDELKRLNGFSGKKKFTIVAGKKIKVYCLKSEEEEKQEEVKAKEEGKVSKKKQEEAETTYCDYKVKRRVESLSQIADKLGVSVKELASMNRLRESAKLRKGRVIKVPCEALAKGEKLEREGVTKEGESKVGKKEIIKAESGKNITPAKEASSAEKLCQYKVKPGDTIFSIAKLANTTPEKIRELNNLSNESKIVVDQLLKVPCFEGAGISDTSGVKEVKKERAKEEIKETPKAESKHVSIKESKVNLPSSFSLKGYKFVSPVGKGVEALVVSNRLDIPLNRGDKIFAVADGKVVYATNNIAGVASLLVVKHGSLYSVYSGEGINLKVKNGDDVRQGEVVGEAKTNTLLRFQIRDKKEAIDPLEYIQKGG